MFEDMTISPALAYDYAVNQNHLSNDVTSPAYVGNYLFMGRDALKGLAFRNTITRQYLYIQDRSIAA